MSEYPTFGQSDRQFVCYFFFVGWAAISFGFHVHVTSPNIEIHLPFGFIRIGWHGVYHWSGKSRILGLQRKRRQQEMR